MALSREKCIGGDQKSKNESGVHIWERLDQFHGPSSVLGHLLKSCHVTPTVFGFDGTAREAPG